MRGGVLNSQPSASSASIPGELQACQINCRNLGVSRSGQSNLEGDVVVLPLSLSLDPRHHSPTENIFVSSGWTTTSSRNSTRATRRLLLTVTLDRLPTIATGEEMMVLWLQ